jgi:4-amino-4-deoxy-L-arabinose transferase-like glycosyltransferase
MSVENTLAPPAAMAATSRYFRFALAVGVVVTGLRLLWLASNPTDLYPDEAQYWLWGQTPDWGYYSKPPLVAWLIWASTTLLGSDGTLAVRFFAPVLHLGTSLFIYAIGRQLFDAHIGFWSAATYLLLPGVTVSAAIISTDVPLLLCWAAALYAFLRARRPEGERWWWAVAGVAAGLGLLAKYAMVLWLGSALLFILMLRDERRHLPGLLCAAAIAFLIYLPNLAWNAAHGFVSYAHTRDNANLGGDLVHPLALLEFLASQFGVFGPLLFAALLVLVVVRPAWLKERPARLLLSFAAPTLAIMLGESLLSRAHPNWAAPAYVSATVLVIAWLVQKGRQALVSASIALHLCFAGFLMVGPQLVAATGSELPSHLDPWNRLRGWQGLGEAVGAILARHPGALLLGDDREVLAALVYYIRPHPFDALEWNPDGGVHDQFEMTTDMRHHLGGDFVFVTAAPKIDDIAARFDSARRLASIVVPRGPDRVRRLYAYELKGFRGYR